MNTQPVTEAKDRRVDSTELAGLLSELATSGKSTAAFAREHGLAPWKLYNALRAQSREATQSRSAVGGARSELVPVRVFEEPRSRTPLELVLTSGYCLRIPPDFDEAALRRLLVVLGRC